VNDVLFDADRKRREAEAMRRLVGDVDFAILTDLIDAVATAYVNQLIQPIPEEWKNHYLRGLIKGLDEAKTLPLRVVRMYDKELEQANAPAPAQPLDNPVMRLSPEPEEIQ